MTNIDTSAEAVERLAARFDDMCGLGTGALRDAAATLRALADQRDGKAQEAWQALDMWKKAVAQRDAARAEVARLREALEPIYAAAQQATPRYHAQGEAMRRILIAETAMDRMRAALAQKEPDNE
jgi:uncharacterized coiled-coil DUF342 family protein